MTNVFPLQEHFPETSGVISSMPKTELTPDLLTQFMELSDRFGSRGGLNAVSHLATMGVIECSVPPVTVEHQVTAGAFRAIATEAAARSAAMR